jgi:hypothetical protein
LFPVLINGDVHAARRRDLERLPGRTGQPVKTGHRR